MSGFLERLRLALAEGKKQAVANELARVRGELMKRAEAGHDSLDIYLDELDAYVKNAVLEELRSDGLVVLEQLLGRGYYITFADVPDGPS